ncbi:hypothetical protein SAMN05660642_01634 [Geodermatophilus siccatus]|uniref:Allene oxide cyclase barrel-like domain-containing protein n=1 Tax=Geodermatophilus siccatus TaxID=1137991 RepID=A0A1G9QE51_9ACTN|nr:hypothetical protein [Geodermatophilus siccatus]SDM09364.1 hypothetical protein SAMN05660642_01634 [Geodermatophilus siccatus]
MSATLRRTALVLFVVAGAPVAAATAATAAPAATDEPTTLQVEGTQTQVSPELYESRGGLLGDFWILSFDPLYESDSLVIGTGSERFVGCVDVDLDEACGAGEPSGELSFDYVQWATFDPSTGALIEGNCTHPITGGTDGFQGARGLVTMHDVVENGEVLTTYEGTVVLDAVPAAAPAARGTAPQALAAGAPASSRGHC